MGYPGQKLKQPLSKNLIMALNIWQQAYNQNIPQKEKNWKKKGEKKRERRKKISTSLDLLQIFKQLCTVASSVLVPCHISPNYLALAIGFFCTFFIIASDSISICRPCFSLRGFILGLVMRFLEQWHITCRQRLGRTHGIGAPTYIVSTAGDTFLFVLVPWSPIQIIEEVEEAKDGQEPKEIIQMVLIQKLPI